MTPPSLPRALILVFALAVSAPALEASAASPAPAPSPSNQCQIPQGLEGDPQSQALQKQCLAEVAAVQGEKDKLAGSLALARGSAQSLSEMLVQTRQAIVDNQKHQDETVQKIHDLEVQMAETQRQMDATKVRLDAKRKVYADFLRRSYKAQETLVTAIFDSHGVGDFLSKAAAIIQVRNYGRDLLKSIHEEEERLRQQGEQLASDRAASVQRKKELADAERQLIKDQYKVAAILAELNSSISDAETALKDADHQSSALVAKIVAAQIARQDELIQMANDAAWEAARAWMASNDASYPPSLNHSIKYPYIWPAQTGVISQWFGPTDYAAEPPMFGAPHFHAGIDIANNSGTPIFAADDGVVVSTLDSMYNGHLIGYGRHVIIAHHNGVMTLYGHLDGYSVKVGDKVHQGDFIGVMGSTGNSSGPHLHFEVRVNGTPVDPKPYLPPNGPNNFRG